MAERFDRIVAELNGESSSLLELVATALFLERNGTDPADLENELGQRKPIYVVLLRQGYNTLVS